MTSGDRCFIAVKLGRRRPAVRIDLNTARSNPCYREAPPIRVFLRLFGLIFIGHTIRRADLNALSISSLAIVGIITSLNSSTFGKPQSAGDPKILQFALNCGLAASVTG